MEDSPQIMLLQFPSNVLRDQVDCDHIPILSAIRQEQTSSNGASDGQAGHQSRAPFLRHAQEEHQASTSTQYRAPGPGNDDVCMFPAGSHELIKGWLHELRVLLDDACNVAAAYCHVALYSAHHPGEQSEG